MERNSIKEMFKFAKLILSKIAHIKRERTDMVRLTDN